MTGADEQTKDSQRQNMRPPFAKRAALARPFMGMRISNEAKRLRAQGVDVINLSLGQPDYGAPEPVREAMRDLYDGRPLPYSDSMGLSELREAIARFYRTAHDVEVDPKRIVITEGGSAALLLATALSVDEGDEVIIADPSYPSNRELVRSFGGKVVDVPTSAATRFHLDQPLVRQYWSERTRAVMITSPSNPTGTTIAPDVLRDVCAYAAHHGAWRIMDETYLDLTDVEADGSRVESALAVDPEAMVCGSFSKFFGMTGWRLGWMVVPEFALDAVDNLATNFFLGAHTPSQYAALACFTPQSLRICEERRQELLERRAFVVDALARIGLPLEVVPNGAFYAYFNISSTGLDAQTFCDRALHEAHVALTPGGDFGPATGSTHVRLSYAASMSDLEVGFERLGDFVASLRR